MNDSKIDHAAFAHQPNPNGTIDSVCLTCFMTIATKPTEPELVPDEHHHHCKGPGPGNFAGNNGAADEMELRRLR